MKAQFNLLTLLLVLAVALLTATGQAGFETIISEEFTVDSGTSFTTVSFPFEGKLVDGWLECPELDATDTATLAMTITPTDDLTSTVAPLGWSTVDIGASSDAAIVKLFSSAPAIQMTGTSNWTVQCKTNQAADRTFRLVLRREY